jgi:5'-3' exonuclease
MNIHTNEIESKGGREELDTELDEGKNLNSNECIRITKLDLQNSVLLIDTSYWLYYRFFALRNWYAKAYPEKVIDNNFNAEHNWLEDEIFMTKYKKLFIDHIRKLSKKFKIKLSNVVFCIDCPHREIWRCEKIDDYKGTRLESHRKKQFTSFNVFSYIKKTLLPILQKSMDIKIIACSKCEADDVIGNFAIYLLENNCPSVLILANDNDYLQICNDKIQLINGAGKFLSSINNDGEKYLITKILIGDISDNIKCCMVDIGYITTGILSGEYKKIYKKLANTLLEDTNTLTVLQTMVYNIRNGNEDIPDNYKKIISFDKFKENILLMDFKMLPNELKINLHQIFCNL